MKVKTLIVDTVPDNGTATGSIENEITSVSVASEPEVVGEMLVNTDQKQSFVLDITTGAAFDKSLYSLFPIENEADIKFIHIQCRLLNTGQGSRFKPARFALQIATLDVAVCSQFQLANIDGFEWDNIRVRAVEVPDGQKAILEVFVAFNI